MQILRTFKNLGLAACFLHGLTEHSYSMLCAQTVVGTEPGASTIQIAPGEITTFHVAGLQLQLDQTIFVKDRPLPTEVAGISLRLRSLETEDLFNVPIFSLRQIDDCPVGMSQPNCRSTLITVHIPVNLKPVGYFSRSPGYPQRELATFRLEISESGVIISSVPVFPVRNHIRILTTCDFVFELNELSDGGCVNIVRHPDGTLAQSLALGQKFSVYVTGIGYGDHEGRLRTGEPSPDNPPVEAFIKIYGEVGVNRPPTVPYGRLSVSMPVPRPYSAAVLVPGQIGVYRVDLSAPSELPESALAGCFNNFTSAFSNYAYSLVAGVGSTQELGSVSYAPLPVCVKESPSTFESIKTEAARLKTVTHQ